MRKSLFPRPALAFATTLLATSRSRLTQFNQPRARVAKSLIHPRVWNQTRRWRISLRHRVLRPFFPFSP